ncbi:MAG: Ig domain-containing protein, partial [Clostridia bacterium]|nr:Ig domain-containing protein [Clostridia bacterium]
LGYKLSSGSAGKVTFSSSEETRTILEVQADGLLNAYLPGEAQVTAQTFNNKKHTLSFTVKDAPTSITADKPSLVLGVGMKDKVAATLNEGSAGAIHYRSEHPEIASVDPATGEIIANAVGVTRIVSYTYVDGVEAYTDVEVKPAPSAVSLPFSSKNIGLGDKLQLDPQIDEGSVTSFKYKSSNTRYATVSESGLISAKRIGTVTITVTTHNKKSFKFTLRIRKVPTSVKVAPSPLVLGVGEAIKLKTTIPTGSSTSMTFASSNPETAHVADDGVVFALAEGTSTITVTTHNKKTASTELTVVPAPQAISMRMPEVLGVGMTAQLSTQLSPENSHSYLTYEVISGDAVTVDANGKLTAVKEGTATVRASTYVEGVYTDQQITVKPAPTSISFGTDKLSVNVDESLTLCPILPDGCYTKLSYKIKKAGIFTIDENGQVTPIMRGSSVVTVTTHNGLSATVTIWVVDPYYPETMKLTQTPPSYLEKGNSYQPKVEIFPDTAIPALVWTSSAPKVISIDETTGEMKALASGVSTIKVKSTRNPSLTASFKIIVPSEGRCLIMPDEKTGTSSIDANMQKIRNVRESAYHELQDLLLSGVINNTVYSRRKAIIDRGFEMYLFPWMTKTEELYWSSKYSEGGKKNFKPGTVYYGVPYTQNRRTWHPANLRSSGNYTDSGKGYYLMNGAKYGNRQYPGSDCSSFASMATWGLNSSRASDNTSKIGSASYYTTISNWKDLRPGDVINKSYKHAIIFLYYTDASKEKMVILEQGGGTKYTNTVSVSIRAVSNYKNNGYKIRRASTIR